MEFHVHTNASLLAMEAILSQNVTRKSDQPIMYTFGLLNKAKQNYSITKKKALIMVFALHKFTHYFLGNKFVFLCKSYDIGLFSQQTTGFKENN